MLPKAMLHAQNGSLIVDDVMPVRVHTGHHGGVTGVGDGGVNGAHPVHPGHFVPPGRQGVQFGQGLQVLVDQGVHADNDHMTFAHKAFLFSVWMTPL